MTTMKYNEDDILNEVITYIKGTYGEHYANPEKQGIQVFDLWDSMDVLKPTCVATSIKYIARFGKKNGYNQKDLFKAIHYIVILLNAVRQETGEIPATAPELLNEASI